MAYNDSGTLVVPEINSGLSTQIIIKVGNTIVGAIQTLVIRQDRDMTVVEEIGNDGIIEIHPKGSTKVTIDVTRIVFDNLRLTESFARGFINIQSQRFPFDIHVIDRSTVKGDATSKLGKFTQNAQRKFSKFTTKDISKLITQDVLVLAGSEDHYVSMEQFHAQMKVLVNAGSVTGRIFTPMENAQNHCQVGNMGLAIDTIINWDELCKQKQLQTTTS